LGSILALWDIEETCHADVVTAFVLLFTWELFLPTAVVALMWLICMSVLWNGRTSRKLTLSLLGAVLVCGALIALASQIQGHVLYLANAFRSILIALFLMELWIKCRGVALGWWNDWKERVAAAHIIPNLAEKWISGCRGNVLVNCDDFEQFAFSTACQRSMKRPRRIE